MPRQDPTPAAVSASSSTRKRSMEEAPAKGPPSKKQHIATEDTSLWSTVRKYLKDPESMPEPRVSCPVCMIDIAIRGVPGQSPCPDKLAREKQKVGLVLSCNHIMCQDCFRTHVASQRDASGDWLDITCPCCRDKLHFSGCGHLVPSRRIPVATFEDHLMVPLTKPELRSAGRELPAQCLVCGDGESLPATSSSWLVADPSDVLLEVKKVPGDSQESIANVDFEGVTTAVWLVPSTSGKKR